MDFPSVACPFCSLHCDDLHLTNYGGHWKLISPPCPSASDRFRKWEPVSAGISSRPFQDAVRILNKAHQPLIVLTGNVEQESVIAAVNLARATSAFLVRNNNTCENITSAMRTAGLLSATLADLRDHADQVVILEVNRKNLCRGFGSSWETRKEKELFGLTTRIRRKYSATSTAEQGN